MWREHSGFACQRCRKNKQKCSLTTTTKPQEADSDIVEVSGPSPAKGRSQRAFVQVPPKPKAAPRPVSTTAGPSTSGTARTLPGTPIFAPKDFKRLVLVLDGIASCLNVRSKVAIMTERRIRRAEVRARRRQERRIEADDLVRRWQSGTEAERQLTAEDAFHAVFKYYEATDARDDAEVAEEVEREDRDLAVMALDSEDEGESAPAGPTREGNERGSGAPLDPKGKGKARARSRDVTPVTVPTRETPDRDGALLTAMAQSKIETGPPGPGAAGPSRLPGESESGGGMEVDDGVGDGGAGIGGSGETQAAPQDVVMEEPEPLERGVSEDDRLEESNVGTDPGEGTQTLL